MARSYDPSHISGYPRGHESFDIFGLRSLACLHNHNVVECEQMVEHETLSQWNNSSQIFRRGFLNECASIFTVMTKGRGRGWRHLSEICSCCEQDLRVEELKRLDYISKIIILSIQK